MTLMLAFVSACLMAVMITLFRARLREHDRMHQHVMKVMRMPSDSIHGHSYVHDTFNFAAWVLFIGTVTFVSAMPFVAASFFIRFHDVLNWQLG